MKEKMWVHRDDDTELSNSKQEPGHKSPLTRDGNKNLGQVTLSEIDEDDSQSGFDEYGPNDPEEEARLERARMAQNVAIAEAILEIAILVAPHLRRWWTNDAYPAIKSARKMLQMRRAEKRRARRASRDIGLISSEDDDNDVNSSSELVFATGHKMQSMTRDEAQRLLKLAVLARMFSDEQLKTVLNARIEEGDGRVELNNTTLSELQELELSVSQLLERNPSLFNDLVEFFERAQPTEAPVLLPKSATRRDAIVLPGAEQ